MSVLHDQYLQLRASTGLSDRAAVDRLARRLGVHPTSVARALAAARRDAERDAAPTGGGDDPLRSDADDRRA